MWKLGFCGDPGDLGFSGSVSGSIAFGDLGNTDRDVLNDRRPLHFSTFQVERADVFDIGHFFERTVRHG